MTSTDQTSTAPGGTATLAGVPVARIGYGAMQLSGWPVGSAPDRATSLAVLRRALEQGVNHLDTANFYGPGTANELIRTTLASGPDGVAVVSKVGAYLADDGTLVPAQRPEELRASVEANLTALGVERLPAVNLRRLDDPAGGLVAEGEQRVDLDSQLAEFVAMRDEGKIGGIGLSTVTLDQLRQALPAGIVCVQNAYSVLDRASEPLLDVCREHDIAWVPYFPLGSAFPDHPKVTNHPTVIAAAKTHGATPAQVGLAWLLAHDPHTLLIPGTANPDHLDENLAAGDVHLAPETIAELDAIAG